MLVNPNPFGCSKPIKEKIGKIFRLQLEFNFRGVSPPYLSHSQPSVDSLKLFLMTFSFLSSLSTCPFRCTDLLHSVTKIAISFAVIKPLVFFERALNPDSKTISKTKIWGSFFLLAKMWTHVFHHSLMTTHTKIFILRLQFWTKKMTKLPLKWLNSHFLLL